METNGCHNCEHEFMNHKRCDLPWGVKCNSGEKWEKRIDLLSKFKNESEPAQIAQKEQSIIANVSNSVCRHGDFAVIDGEFKCKHCRILYMDSGQTDC